MDGMHGCRIIDGKKIAALISDETAELLRRGRGSGPTMLAISIGSDATVESYSRQKERAAGATGIGFRREHFGIDAGEEEVAAVLRRAANDAEVSAIMIHLPVPPRFDIDALSGIIPPEKDVDCLSNVSRGMLFSGNPVFSPATAEAVMEILKHEQVDTAGKHVVILGRSLTVGKPLANLLLMRGRSGDATVTVCHSKSGDTAKFTREADILVVAAGKPRMVTGEMIRRGATVVDVGINTSLSPETGGKYCITGDVDFDSAVSVAGAITPVPGGVGPVTSSVLMRNVARAWLKGLS